MRGDVHEAVAASLLDQPLTRAHQRIVGPRERDAVDDHELTRVAGQIDALPQAQRPEQTGARLVGEPASELGQLRVTLTPDVDVGETLAYDFGGPLGGPTGGEEPQAYGRPPLRRGR